MSGGYYLKSFSPIPTRLIRVGVLLIVLNLIGYTLLAQDKIIEYREQTWVAYFNQTRFSDKWGLWTDIHFRFTDNFIDRLGLTIFRFAPMYYINDQTRLTAGYAYVTAYSADDTPNIPEHRFWQQIQWFEKKKHVTMMQYFRVEERFRGNVVSGELSEDYLYSWRFRYNISLTIPLKEAGLVPKSPFLFLNDEIHINAGRNITNNYFDQNRLFVGMGYQFTNQLNAQLGYLFVFQQVSTPYTFVHTDAIRFFVFHNLDFRNSE